MSSTKAEEKAAALSPSHNGTLEQDDAPPYDNERRGSRRTSRIGGPVGRKLSIGDPETDSVGKQMELEASNSIKYRTCSWQKVRAYHEASILNMYFPHGVIPFANGLPTDCGAPILRIHLSWLVPLRS